MTGKEDRASSGTLPALQHLTGINIIDAAAWFGPALASLWFYTGMRSDGGFLPSERPAAWIGRMWSWAGLKGTWTSVVDDWLTARPIMFWVFLIAALVLTSMTWRHESTSLLSLVCLTLLGAASIRSLGTTLFWFLGLSLAAALTGYILDAIATKTDRRQDRRSFADPWHTFTKWVGGPCITVAFIGAFPLLLIASIVRPYRTEDLARRPARELVEMARRLPASPVSETSADVALPFLAAAALLQRDPDEAGQALLGLAYDGPAGAKPSSIPPRHTVA